MTFDQHAGSCLDESEVLPDWATGFNHLYAFATCSCEIRNSRASYMQLKRKKSDVIISIRIRLPHSRVCLHSLVLRVRRQLE